MPSVFEIGPVPPFNNPPIQPQDYNPSQFFIEDITLGQTTIVTATEDMNFVIGQEVRLFIPQPNGCYQLNQEKGYVISLPASNQVEITIDSSQNVNPFVSTNNSQQPQIIPLGDINQGAINASGRNNTGTYIQGSFINVSR